MLDMRFSIAPMMEWTDRHCRFFHRLLTRRARIYTEMITTAAVLYGDRARLLAYDPAEHPLALEAGCAAAEPPRGTPGARGQRRRPVLRPNYGPQKVRDGIESRHLFD